MNYSGNHNSQTIIQKVEEYIKPLMRAEYGHDLNHIKRVRNWAIKIAKAENYDDLLSAEVAALMNDIGLARAEKRRLHGEVGAKMAYKFLTREEILDTKRIDDICNAIRFHNKNREGDGILLFILRDADMLDMFGPIGIMRGCTSYASHPEYDYENVKGETWNMTSKDFDQRFDVGIGVGSNIIDCLNFQISCFENLKTDTVKRIAKPLVQFMKDFILKLESNVKQSE